MKAARLSKLLYCKPNNEVNSEYSLLRKLDNLAVRELHVKIFRSREIGLEN